MRERIRSDDGYATDNSESCSDSEKMTSEEPDFGILFDVDGVIARGSTPLPAAVEAVKHLRNGNSRLRVPVAFVTNACSTSTSKAAAISEWLGIDVTPDMVIHAPTPCKVLTEYHDKLVLVIGQDNRKEIANDLGFNNICFIEDIKDSYPLLDMVDHENRKIVAKGFVEKQFPRVEAIVLLGEPARWETHLQLLLDLLLTEGLPTKAPSGIADHTQLPVIACNMDLQFMAEACMPRFGSGAFLVCLEALYKKVTGRDLEYDALVGKPVELTYRYAEHVITQEAKKLGIKKKIQKLYFMGDNPLVDIVGANMYDQYLRKNRSEENGNITDNDLPLSRKLPDNRILVPQSVKRIFSVLVCTGVYNPKHETHELETVYHGHRDIENQPSLTRPTKVVQDVHEGIKFILKEEQFSCH
ncbi:LOW QUALITY PROTEIN: haloacid dehalogenase-like hydrolase domain-containing 5 [Liolophura sinensis]|uniref:LOW QUALITY PROTEIN: haloacid dehalogenase-like hydrolase domain-containing 5 n=1 Tax=Liolophura sinensis TaxID=3198878 RepID=UPI003158772C